MKKYRPYIIMAITTVAMVGLIIVQAYWIKNAIQANREQFDRQVYAALGHVTEKYEKRKTLDFFNENQIIDKMPNPDSMFSEALREKEFNFDSLLSLHAGEMNYNNHPNTTVKKKIIIGQDTMLISSEFPTDTTLKYLDSVRELWSKNWEKLFGENGIIGKLAFEFSHFGGIKFQNEEIQKLGEEIKSSLMEQDITLPFKYGVRIGDEEILHTYSEDPFISGSPVYKMRIFPDAVYANEAEVALTFPDREMYDLFILSRIGGILSTSILFILILTGSFIWLVRNFFRQKKLSEMKTDFINNMTHELKTPISTIALANEALRDKSIGHDPDRLDRFTSVIADENKRLGMQVERVLQMARLEKDKVNLDRMKIGLNGILQKVVKNNSLRLREKNAEIIFRPSGEEIYILADPVHITNIFDNLIDNALKYNKNIPRIEITVAGFLEKVRIEVKDNGIGMSREQQKRAFDRFYRASTGNVHDVKGFGLGLSYVKNIVEAHKGEVTLVSNPGKGSVFSVYFPIIKEK